jgi:hypothetical protein
MHGNNAADEVADANGRAADAADVAGPHPRANAIARATIVIIALLEVSDCLHNLPAGRCRILS